MARLVAVDLPGGDQFVAALRRIWDAGDTAFPIDQRMPAAAKAALVARMGVHRVADPTGETDVDGGRSTEPGDALVVATSGSGGEPKGVVLTHSAIDASARATSARIGVRDDDHWLACLPLSHVGGLSVVTRALATGTRLSVHDGFDAERVGASRATLVSLVPTALRRIDPTRWRVIVLGGARPPDDRPTNTMTTYGMTETGSGVVYDSLPLDGVEMRIVGGEIQLRCPMLLRCYRDGTDPRTDDGWYPTGDLGAIEPDGRLTVHGRAGDLIITGGENVWPEPVEEILRSHAAIADVAVAGSSDPEWGQAVTAYVVPVPGVTPPTLEYIRALVKAQLPAFHAPRRLHLVDELPRTALGKLRRAELPAGPGGEVTA